MFIHKDKETIDKVKSKYAYNTDIHIFFSKDVDDSIFLEVPFWKKEIFQFRICFIGKRKKRSLKYL